MQITKQSTTCLGYCHHNPRKLQHPQIKLLIKQDQIVSLANF